MENKIGENIDVGIRQKCGLPKEICICDYRLHKKKYYYCNRCYDFFHL